MNIKFSQLPKAQDAQSLDIFPILRNGENLVTSISAVYDFLSGDKIKDVYTSYNQNSSIFINDNILLNSVYTTYNQNSGSYVSFNTPSTDKWESASTKLMSSSANWDSTYTSWRSTSGNLIKSDITIAPQATAIKNIIAVPLEVYQGLLVKDPYTFYIVV
jgi:hypothetical protein